MIKAILYSPEGYEFDSIVPGGPELISILQPDFAIETWKVGLVRGRLSIRLKTVEAVNQLLQQAADGSIVEITYVLAGFATEIQETRTVHHFARVLKPVLMPFISNPLCDGEVVRRLGAHLSSYIRVTYRLVDRHHAQADRPEPRRARFAAALAIRMAEAAAEV